MRISRDGADDDEAAGAGRVRQRNAAAAQPPARAARLRRLGWAGFWLGFGLAMFFDGILLHQILQWHHILSGVAPDETVFDLRFQVLADGIFHLVTYALTALGLWLLWANRAGFADSGTDRRLVGCGLVGFGVWHIVDAVLNHWIIGLHRIRMDVENPLLWDLAWVAPFGVGVALLGLWLLKRPPRSGGSGRRWSGVAPFLLVLAVLVSAPLSARPSAGTPDDRALVLFRPGMDFGNIVAATDAVGGRLVWSDPVGGVWLIVLDARANTFDLYRHGALMVSNGPVAVGCLSWARI